MIVVKVGGNGDLELDPLCADVLELVRGGEQVVLVHGGSHETDVISTQLGHAPHFVTSLSGNVSRYTDRETLEIFVMVTAGRINKLLVERLQRLGVNALGLSGLDGRLLTAKRKEVLKIVEDGKPKVLRGDHSGSIVGVDVSLLKTLLSAGYVPVVAPVAAGLDGEALNVDADRVAGALASALHARDLVLLSNVAGVLRQYPDESTLISHIAPADVEQHIARFAQGRMKKKLLGAVEAVQQGVGRAVIADGRVGGPVHHALLGFGTVIA